jgi:hypothetical protein
LLRTEPADGVTRPLLPRTFNYFSQMAGENAQSRIYLGIHWRFDGVEGIRSGDGIGDYVYTHALNPRHGHLAAPLPSMDPEAQINLAVSLENVAANGGVIGSAHSVALVTAVSAAPGAGTPSGVVVFMEAGTVLGTGTLDANGQATLVLDSLSSGTHQITACYAGDGNFQDSLSDPVSIVVN